MNIDMVDILLGLLSQIPWWVYPIIILGLYIRIKMDNMELEHHVRKKEKIYEKIDKEKSEKNKYSFEKTKLTNKQKKDKGDRYEEYICDIYKNKGYRIAPHGKDNGVQDQGIDIIAKKGKEILFIQCKDWDIENKYKITHKDIQYIRMNVRDYLHVNPLFQEYSWKILYVTSDNIFHKSAYHKINEHDDEIESKIIPMKH